MATAVYLGKPPLSGFLVLWGRDPHIWWGLVKLRVAVEASGLRSELPVAAWVPASSLTRPGWSSSNDEIPRITLPDDQRSWPPPIGWPHWYAGVWLSGAIALPNGVALTTGPAWRR